MSVSVVASPRNQTNPRKNGAFRGFHFGKRCTDLCWESYGCLRARKFGLSSVAVVVDWLQEWTAGSGNLGSVLARRSIRRSAARSYARSLIRIDLSDSKWSTNASTTAIAVSNSSLMSCFRRLRSM